MESFMDSERPLKGVVQSLMAANGITDRPPPPNTPLGAHTLAVISVHCNADVFEFLCARGVSDIMLKNPKQLEAILPYILEKYPDCDMTDHSWVEAMAVVGGDDPPVPGSLRALVKQMHRDTPQKVMYLFKHAMGIERAARKARAKAAAVPPEPSPPAVKVAAPAALISMHY
jgi:hypothetical protein